MTKKLNEIKALERKKKEKMNKTNDNNNNYSKDLPNEEKKSSQHVNAIPVIEEQFSISKKTVTENVKIEKRWITVTKNIEVPVSIEEVYINDKNIKSRGKDDDVLSELNKRIIQSFEDMDDSQKKQYSVSGQNETKRELVPLLFDDDGNNNNSSNDTNHKETAKKVIPILGEEIVISKRIVKLGELVMSKNKVTENKKIAIDTKNEKVMIKYPNGSTKIL
jgi:stress response protein YsnF